LPSPLHCHLHPLKSRLAGNHNHPILQQAHKGRRKKARRLTTVEATKA
jgi:hypothetical protein